MKIRFILFFVAIGMIMAFAPTNFPLDLRVVPIAPSISDSVWLLGHKKTTGVYTTYRFSMPQLASYLGAGTGLGNNFANADLTLPMNRTHDFAKHSMTWDSVYSVTIKDTSGNAIFSLGNSVFSVYSGMIRANKVGNQFTLNTTDGRSGIAGNSPSLLMNNGSSNVFLTSIAGLNFARMGVSGGVQLLIDSGSHLVTLGICPNCITYNWVTGATTINGAYTLPLVDALSTDQFLTSNGGGIGSWSTISKLGLVTRYNGGAVAGNGIPAIRAHASGAGSTTAVTITSLTSSANVYEVGGYVNINSVTTDVLAFRVTYTDLGGIIHTQDMTPNGGTVTTLANVQHYFFPKVEIMPQLGSTISLRTVLTTGGGSINYDYSGTITQVD